MRPIDEKIVSMKLDNRDFAAKAAQTTGIIGALTKTLNLIPGVNLGKTSKELGDIRNQANNTNFNKLAESVQTIASRFTALGIIGVTALQNITNKAVDAGLALAKSLTVDQVTAGFREYELKISSIKTILANTEWDNTTLDEVKDSLEDLNDYADKTVYNFAQMTSNIGRFTAAGVKLDDATIAIKGLSNLAAVSGAEVYQLNTAMYQMSQAMAAGRMNLMDWNSLTNAGMGGKITQDALLDTAKAMGVVVDMTDGFRNSIGDGWLTSEIFLETLRKFGSDESMTEAATKVRTLTQFIDTLKESIGSGWAMTFEHVFGDFEESTKLWSEIAERVTGWIGEVSDSRNKFFSEAADLGAMDNLFKGVSDAITPIIQLFRALKEGFERVFPPMSVSRFVQITESFKEFAAGLTMGTDKISRLTTIFQGIFALFSTAIEIVKRLTSAFVSLIPEGTGNKVLNLLVRLAEMSIRFNESVKAGNGLTDAIDALANGLRTVGGYMINASASVVTMAKFLREKLGGALSFVLNLLKPVWQFLKETFSGFGMQEALGAGTLAGGFLLFKKFGDILENVTGLFDTATNGISGLFSGLGDALSSFTQQVKYNNLLKIAVAVGILAVSLKLLEGMETEDIVQGIAALGASLGLMLGAMVLIEKFSIMGGIKASVSLIALATAVTIMAVALKTVAALDFNEILRGVTGLLGITATLSIAMIAMSKFGGKVKAGSLQLIALATAVVILATAVKTLSDIDTAQLWKAIAALGVIFLELAIFLKIVDKSKLSVSSAVGLTIVAATIHIMISAINKISDIDTGSLVKGLVTITLILAQMAIFSKLVKGPTLLMAGAGLLLVAAALTALMIPIKTLGNMSWEELLKGLGGITAAMLAIAGASLLMSGTIVSGLGMMVMATGLTMLLIPIKAFASMTWGDMLKGFAGLALSMIIVAGASLLLSPAIIPMLGFGAALLLMGAAMLATGLGVGLFGAGLAVLASLTATSVAAIISALKMLLEGLGSLIIYIVKFVVELGLALLGGIDALAPKLIVTIANLIMKLIETIVDKLPEFLRLGSEFIIKLMNGIGEYAPKIVDAAINMIVDVVDGLTEALAKHGPRITDSFVRLFGEIIILVIQSGEKMIQALFGWIPGVKDVASKIGGTAEKYIRENFGATSIGEDKGEEFVEGLLTKEQDARKAGKKLGDAGKDGLGSVPTKNLGINFGQGFILGMGSKTGDISKAAQSMGFTAIGGITDSLKIKSPSKVTKELGGHTGQGFADGIGGKKSEVSKKAEELARAAKEAFEKEHGDVNFKYSMEIIDVDKYLSELDRIKDAYKQYPDLVRKVELEASGIRQKVVKDEFTNFKKGIDSRKYYNELSLTEELREWTLATERYKEGTEQRIEADREVYRVKNQINNQLKDLNEEYMSNVEGVNQRLLEGQRALNDEYNKAVTDRTNQIANFSGLFDEFQKKSDVSGTQLIANLKSQVDAIVDWRSNLDQLSEKGLDEALLSELRQMGPKAAGELEALNSLTSEELSSYNLMWQTKHQLAREQSIKELEGLRIDTANQIEELRKETEIQLDTYTSEWKTKVEQLRQGTSDQFLKLEDEMSIAGENAIKGLIEGLSSKESLLKAKVAALSELVYKTVNKVLDIKSPSRVMMKLGEHAGEGLAVGLFNTNKSVGDRAKELALSAKDSLNKFLEGFNSNPEDNEIKLKVVVDDSDFDPKKYGSRIFAPTPNTSFTTRGVSAISTANRQNDNNSRSDQSSEDRVEGKSVVVHQNLTFNSRQLTPSEVARKNVQASKQLAMQWG